jgi:4-hydroxyphenylacetate 3-monooxygenase
MRRGADYIGSIKRDGRTILLEGAAVDDVTSHPGFAGPVGVIAALYDGAADNGAITYE